MDYCEYPSPVGTLYLTADEGSLTGIWMHPEKTKDFPVLEQARHWLDAYFSGNPQQPDFPLNPHGTACVVTAAPQRRFRLGQHGLALVQAGGEVVVWDVVKAGGEALSFSAAVFFA